MRHLPPPKRGRVVWLSVLALWWGLSGCYDMHDQPSFKPQEGPRLSSPGEAVAVQGVEILDPAKVPINPVVVTKESLEAGKRLFEINCAMCHGREGRGDGPVGKKWIVPCANLHQDRIHRLSDGDLFNRITAGYGTMPGFARRLAPEERWHIVNYARQFK